MIFNGWNTKWKYFFLSFKSPIFGVCIRFKQKSHCQESHNSFDRSMFSTDMYRAIIFSTCHCFFLPSLLFQQNHCQNYLFFFFFFFIFSILATLLPQLQSFFFSFLSPISAKPLLELSFFFLSSLFWQHLWCNNNLFFFLFFLSPISTKPSRTTLFFLSSSILATPLSQLQFFFLSSPLFRQIHCYLLLFW